MYRTDFWTLGEKARVGCFERTTSKHVYHLGWNRSPAQVGCMRQVLGPGALGRPRGIGWRGRWERGSGWGIHVNPWLIHVNVWQKPLQYCKVISLQLIKMETNLLKITVMYHFNQFKVYILCCCSVIYSCLILFDPIYCSTPGFPVRHYIPSLLKITHWFDFLMTKKTINLFSLR